MLYELEKLNKYINQDLKNLLDQTVTKDEVVDFEKWIKNIGNEIERIKKAFINAAFGSQNDKQIERYIEYHQVELIRLTDPCLVRCSTQASFSLANRPVTVAL